MIRVREDLPCMTHVGFLANGALPADVAAFTKGP